MSQSHAPGPASGCGLPQAALALLDALPGELALLDAQGNVLAVNEGWRRFPSSCRSRASEGLAEGANYLDVCARSVEHGDASALEPLEGLRDVLGARRQRFLTEYACDTPSGVRWFLMEVVPADVGPVRAVVSHTDITERRSAEVAAREAARANEDVLNSFYDSAALMMGVVDVADDDVVSLLHANPAARHFFGLPSARNIDASAAESPPRALQALLAQHCRRCEAERRPIRFHHEWRSQAGPRWVNATVACLGRRWPGHTRFSFVAEDVTERRELELQLLDADRRKDQFLAVLAHELRNPLAPLRNGVQIMRVTRSADPELVRTVDMMDRQLAHLVRLVDDLLDISRISRGKIVLRRENVALADVLAKSVEASRAAIESHGQSLAVRVPAEGMVVDGDPDRLAQVFSNLLVNAAKYGQRGAAVRLAAERDGDDAVVRVSDAGIGIAPEDLDRVFDLFSQVADHEGRSEGGLGIGLSLVRTLVRMHGGAVTAESPGRGRGSTFVVRLPLTSAHPRAEGPPREASSRNAPRRVLVVDDNLDAAQSLAALLRLDGHRVEIAQDGIEALERVEADAPELVFMDLGMPRLDGIETVLRLRRLTAGRDAFVVALTGWGQEADRERTRAAGFDLHLVKPITNEALREVFGALREQRKPPGANRPPDEAR